MHVMDLRVYGDRQNAADNPPVDCQTSLPQVEYINQTVPVAVERKRNVIDPRADDAEEHHIDEEIHVSVRILSGLLRPLLRDPKPDQHRGGDHDPVIGDRKIPDADVLSDMFQINTEIWKIDIIIHFTR